MRNDISPNIISKLEQNGCSPIQLLEIHFLNSGILYLSDRPLGISDGLANEYLPAVEEWGNFVFSAGNNRTRDDGLVNQMTITFLEIGDFKLSSFLQANTFEATECFLYQWEYSRPESEKFLIDKLYIADPIKFGQSDRLFTLDFVSSSYKWDMPVGEIITKINYPDCDNEDVGKFLPIVSGSPGQIPTFKTKVAKYCTLKNSILKDDTTIPVNEDLNYLNFPLSGTIQIGDEFIYYPNRTFTAFTNCQRGKANPDKNLLTRFEDSFNSSDDNWEIINGVLTTHYTYIEVNFNQGVAGFIRKVVSFLGKNYYIIRVNLKRISGSAPWEGKLYYKTTGHNYSETYKVSYLTPPTDLNSDYFDIEFDMSVLSDWMDNIITEIRLDIVSSDGDSWAIQYIKIGSYFSDQHLTNDEIIEHIGDHTFLLCSNELSYIGNVLVNGFPAPEGTYQVYPSETPPKIEFSQQPYYEKFSSASKAAKLQFDSVDDTNTALWPEYSFDENEIGTGSLINGTTSILALKQETQNPNLGQIRRVYLAVAAFTIGWYATDHVDVSIDGIGVIGSLSKPDPSDQFTLDGNVTLDHGHLHVEGGDHDHNFTDPTVGNTYTPPTISNSDPGHLHSSSSEGNEITDTGNRTYPIVVATYSSTPPNPLHIETVIFTPKSGFLRQFVGYGFMSDTSLDQVDVIFVFTDTSSHMESYDGIKFYQGTYDIPAGKVLSHVNYRFSSGNVMNAYFQIGGMTLHTVYSVDVNTNTTGITAGIASPGNVITGIANPGNVNTQTVDNSGIAIKHLDDVVNLSDKTSPLDLINQDNSTKTLIDLFDITDLVNFDWSWFTDKTVKLTYVNTGENKDVYVLHMQFEVEFSPKEINFSDIISADVVGTFNNPIDLTQYLLEQKAGETSFDYINIDGQQLLTNSEFDTQELVWYETGMVSDMSISGGKLILEFYYQPYSLNYIGTSIHLEIGKTYKIQVGLGVCSEGVKNIIFQVGKPLGPSPIGFDSYVNHGMTFPNETFETTITVTEMSTVLLIFLVSGSTGSTQEIDYIRVMEIEPSILSESKTKYNELGYTVDGLIKGDKIVKDVIENLNRQTHGRLFQNGGKIKHVVKTTDLNSVRDIIKSDVFLKSETFEKEPRFKIANKFDLKYDFDFNTSNGFQNLISAQNAASITNYGLRYEKSKYDFELIKNSEMGTAISLYYLSMDGQPASWYTFALSVNHLDLEPEDVIKVSLDFHGLNETLLTIRGIERVFGSGKNNQLNRLIITAEFNNENEQELFDLFASFLPEYKPSDLENIFESLEHLVNVGFENL